MNLNFNIDNYDDFLKRLNEIKPDEIGDLNGRKIEKIETVRLMLCEQLVKHGGLKAARFVAENFDKLRIDGAPSSDRLKLLKAIVKQGNSAALKLITNFKNLGLDQASKSSDCIDLCMEISDCGYGRDMKLRLLEAFEKLGLDEAPISDRLKFCKKIGQLDSWVQRTLAENFEKLGFLRDIQRAQGEERVALFKKIAGSGLGGALGLVQNFDQLGFDNLSVSGRLELCKIIIEQEEFAAIGLIENAHKLSLGSDHFALYKIIAEQGDGPAYELVANVHKLDLEQAEIAECFELCMTIAAQGSMSAEKLAAGLTEFGLEDAPFKDRLALSERIGSQTVGTYGTLIHNFTKSAGFLKDILSVEGHDRLKLCEKIAGKGEWASMALAIYFEKLGLDELPVSDRLDLYRKMVRQGQGAASEVVTEFTKLRLDNLSLSERFELCKEIIAQGDGAAAKVLSHLTLLGLDNASLSDRFDLGMKAIVQGKHAARVLTLIYDELKIGELPIDKRLKLYKAMMRQRSVQATIWLIDNYEHLGLDEAPSSERLDLAKLITKNGEVAVQYLAAGIINFIRGSYVSERLELYDSIMSHGEGATIELACNYRDLGLNEESFPLHLAFCKELSDETFEDPSLLAKLFTENCNDQKNLQLLFEAIGFSHLHHFSQEDPFEAFDRFLSYNPKLSALKPLYDEIKKTKNPVHKQQLFRWAVYTAEILYDLDPGRTTLISENGLLKAIHDFRNPSTRHPLSRQLSCIPIEKLKKVHEEAQPQTWSKVPWIILCDMQRTGFSEEWTLSIQEKIHKNSRCFKDGKRLQALTQLLQTVIEIAPYDKGEVQMIEAAISQAFDHDTNMKQKANLITNDLHSLSNIINIFGKEEFLSCLRSKKSGQTFFAEKFQELFKIEEPEKFEERYQKTLGKFRDQKALITYLGSVMQLTEKSLTPVKEMLNLYVNSVLDGTFPGIRYQTKENPQLEFLSEKYEGLIDDWKRAEPPEKLQVEDVKNVTTNYKKFLKDKIFIHGHLDPEKFPSLRNYLYGTDTKTIADEDPEERKFEALAIDLCNENIKAEEFVNQVFQLSLDLDEFANDLKSLIPKKIMGEFTIQESDDACDLLMLGTDVQGSCQRVDGNPELNKYLVSIIMDGELRPIVVKGKGGTIVARSLMRLMWDEKNQTPVIILETMYANTNDPSIKEAIKDKAIEKAKKMSIPLISMEFGEGPEYPLVESKGGRAPGTYCDAFGGGVKGLFEVQNCFVLYSPESEE
jgi:hypothetical protein